MINTIDQTVTPLKNSKQTNKKKTSKGNTLIPTGKRNISSRRMSNDANLVKPRAVRLNGSLDDDKMIEVINQSKNDSPSKKEKLLKQMKKQAFIMNQASKITIGP